VLSIDQWLDLLGEISLLSSRNLCRNAKLHPDGLGNSNCNVRPFFGGQSAKEREIRS